MSGRRKVQEDSGPKVPGYIVTFSDMVTLLLTFFVMLLSLANTQDPELVDKGRDSFVRSMQTLVLGVLIGRQNPTDFTESKLYYDVPEPEDTDDRTIDAELEQLKRLMRQIQKEMSVMPSQITSSLTSFLPVDVLFAGGSAELNDTSRRALNEYCLALKEEGCYGVQGLYVLGLAGDVRGSRGQMMLSAKRAGAAGELMRSMLSGQDIPIYWWGAGDGGDWALPTGAASKKSHILIAVLR